MDLESNSEEKEAVADNQEVPNEEATVETIGTLEERYRDRHLAIGSHRVPPIVEETDPG
jgi:hypothetical protein